MQSNDSEGRASDRTIVDVNDDYERAYWTKKFGCSADQLREAVAQVGTDVEHVQYQLKRGN